MECILKVEPAGFLDGLLFLYENQKRSQEFQGVLAWAPGGLSYHILRFGILWKEQVSGDPDCLKGYMIGRSLVNGLCSIWVLKIWFCFGITKFTLHFTYNEIREMGTQRITTAERRRFPG